MRTNHFATSVRRATIAGLALALCSVAGAAAAATSAPGDTVTTNGLEQVNSFLLLRPAYSWDALDNRHIIVWATAFRPYLVELAFPIPSLKFSHVIAVTSFGSRVHSGFDSVRVRGLPYRIKNIYKLTRTEARDLAREA